MTARPPWKEPARVPTRIGKALALVVVIALVMAPFLVVVSTSIASPREVTANGGWVLWPTEPTLSAYEQIWQGGIVTRALLVSAGVTLAGTALSLATTALLAYALARPEVVGGRPLLMLILFTFLFPPGMIPAYLVVKNVGLLDSYASLILPVLLNVFNLIVMRGFFQSIPAELFEAARLDGAGDWRILWRVVVPLSKAALAVVGLFYAVGYWNSWFTGMLYLQDTTKWPLQLVLRTYVTSGGVLADPSAQSDGAFAAAPQTIQMAVVVMATLPIVLVYPFLQRYFVRGVMTGAIKT
ncbi:carbohydrate ABC transporter permease [Dactylosporangium vinaceum]|uniref:Carbohydrate ABC transporter permease n=1 Tax=Dactylosporangium vinaceum TaxID=53362 RepID=A0ABV5MS29_9ACTN|nr:carbohydrate ABC transporter permease [Dactylosporangium vinaceum]UAC00319.1 carbohydrate ABC transporter permease [Dactylosporangium vinaceum]